MTANKLKPNNARFFIFQLLGWSGWVVLLIVRDLTFVPAEYMVSRSGIFILDALVGMTLTTCLRYLYRYVWEMAAYIRVATVLGGSFVVSRSEERRVGKEGRSGGATGRSTRKQSQ